MNIFTNGRTFFSQVRNGEHSHKSAPWVNSPHSFCCQQSWQLHHPQWLPRSRPATWRTNLCRVTLSLRQGEPYKGNSKGHKSHCHLVTSMEVPLKKKAKILEARSPGKSLLESSIFQLNGTAGDKGLGIAALGYQAIEQSHFPPTLVSEIILLGSFLE